MTTRVSTMSKLPTQTAGTPTVQTASSSKIPSSRIPMVCPLPIRHLRPSTKHHIDCVSFKPNSTNVVVQNPTCIGSHGMSVGSLGQYANRTDIVENLYIYNVSLTNSSDGARIKVWPGIQTSFQTLLNGGGGLGRVKNVTWDRFHNDGNDRAITITQCYGQKNQTLCYQHPVCTPSAGADMMLGRHYVLGEFANRVDRQTLLLKTSPSRTCGARLLRSTIHRAGR